MKTYRIIFFILYTLLLFSFSLQPAEISSELSSGFGTWLVENIFPGMMETIEEMPAEQLDKLHTLLRKCAHFTEFCILGMLSVITFSKHKLKYNIRTAILYCILVASVDETIQLFVSGRSGQVTDVLLDSTGALTGICIVYVVYRIIMKKREFKHEQE